MATIKSYTDEQQSKKLAEILPLESADMWYDNNGESIAGRPEVMCYSFVGLASINIPCWSLSALLDVLPSATLDSSDDHHYRVHCNERFTDWYDNPIDCCVAMINRLHEQMIYDFNNINGNYIKVTRT